MGDKTFASIVYQTLDVFNLVIPLIFAVTLAVVIWKLSKAWILGGGDPGSIEEGKSVALVAVIAFVFMAGIWGIVEILRNSLF